MDFRNAFDVSIIDMANNFRLNLHDSFESEGLHFPFSSSTPLTELACIRHFPLRRLTLPKKEPFLKEKLNNKIIHGQGKLLKMVL